MQTTNKRSENTSENVYKSRGQGAQTEKSSSKKKQTILNNETSSQKENIHPQRRQQGLKDKELQENSGNGSIKRISDKTSNIRERKERVECLVPEQLFCEQSAQTDNVDDQGLLLNKLRIENIKLEKALKQAQENLAVHKKNQNNTSSQFMLPSEFKVKWENLLKETLPNVFVNFLESPFIFTNVVQEVYLGVHEQVTSDIAEKDASIMQILGAPPTEQHSCLKQTVQLLYQNCMNYAFSFKQEHLQQLRERIHTRVQAIIDTDYNNNNSQKCSPLYNFQREECTQYAQELLLDENNTDFIQCVQQLYTLCLYQLLHDPPLRLPVAESSAERTPHFQIYEKNAYYLIDGFAQEGQPCLVVLPPVTMKNGYPYTGLRQSVLVLDDEEYANCQEIIKVKEEYQNKKAAVLDAAAAAAAVQMTTNEGKIVQQLPSGEEEALRQAQAATTAEESDNGFRKQQIAAAAAAAVALLSENKIKCTAATKFDQSSGKKNVKNKSGSKSIHKGKSTPQSNKKALSILLTHLEGKHKVAGFETDTGRIGSASISNRHHLLAQLSPSSHKKNMERSVASELCLSSSNRLVLFPSNSQLQESNQKMSNGTLSRSSFHSPQQKSSAKKRLFGESCALSPQAEMHHQPFYLKESLKKSKKKTKQFHYFYLILKKLNDSTVTLMQYVSERNDSRSLQLSSAQISTQRPPMHCVQQTNVKSLQGSTAERQQPLNDMQRRDQQCEGSLQLRREASGITNSLQSRSQEQNLLQNRRVVSVKINSLSSSSSSSSSSPSSKSLSPQTKSPAAEEYCSESRIINQEVLLDKRQKERSGDESARVPVSKNNCDMSRTVKQIHAQGSSTIAKSFTNRYARESIIYNSLEDTQALGSVNAKKNELFNALLAIKKSMSVLKNTHERKVGKIVNQSFKRQSSFIGDQQQQPRAPAVLVGSSQQRTLLKENDCALSFIKKYHQSQSGNSIPLLQGVAAVSNHSTAPQRQSSHDFTRLGALLPQPYTQSTAQIHNRSCLRSQSVKRTMHSVLDSSSDSNDEEYNSKGYCPRSTKYEVEEKLLAAAPEQQNIPYDSRRSTYSLCQRREERSHHNTKENSRQIFLPDSEEGAFPTAVQIQQQRHAEQDSNESFGNGGASKSLSFRFEQTLLNAAKQEQRKKKDSLFQQQQPPAQSNKTYEKLYNELKYRRNANLKAHNALIDDLY